MKREEIQFELTVCTLRPQDASDEARAELETDEELRRWFETECAQDESLCNCLNRRDIPDGLRDRILRRLETEKADFGTSGKASVPLKGVRPGSGWLAVAAAIAVGLFIGRPWDRPDPSPDWQSDAIALLDRIETGRASLDAFSGDMAVLKTSLQDAEAPVPAEFPKSVGDIPMLGCKACYVAGQRASVICFRLNENNEAHVVILDTPQPGLDGTADSPAMGAVGEWSYARWQQEGKTYFLATRAPATELQKLFAILRREWWGKAWV